MLEKKPSDTDYVLCDIELFDLFTDFYVDVRDKSHHMVICSRIQSVEVTEHCIRG